MPDGNIQAYIGDPPEQFGHVDDVVEIKYFIKALETRLKYCPKQIVCITISPDSARLILRALKRGTKQ